MARRRMIDPNIWQSEDFSKLSTLAKLVFIGLFSQADDEGRGRAKPIYIKSILFPYDEKVRLIDIETALSEIALNLSVTFYSVGNGNEYYSLNNWENWQTIDKPKPSKIPSPKGFENIPGFIGDESATNRRRVGDASRLKEKKGKGKEEEKEKENTSKGRSPRFVPPTVEEVSLYCRERGNRVDPQKFVDHYTSNGWMVGKTPMKDWKAAVRNWEKNAINLRFGEQKEKAQKYQSPGRLNYAELEKMSLESAKRWAMEAEND